MSHTRRHSKRHNNFVRCSQLRHQRHHRCLISSEKRMRQSLFSQSFSHPLSNRQIVENSANVLRECIYAFVRIVRGRRAIEYRLRGVSHLFRQNSTESDIYRVWISSEAYREHVFIGRQANGLRPSHIRSAGQYSFLGFGLLEASHFEDCPFVQ